MSRTCTFWLLVLILTVGILVRSYHITARSMWFDESFTARLIEFPISELIARTAADVHPPLYYILVKYWAFIFGSSALALRSFSVMCAAFSLFSAYLFTAEAFRSKRAGLIAAALLAASPWTIAYSWEARMYTLGMALALFSSLALLRAIRKQSFVWFTVYGVLAAAFLYVHYYALFTIAAQAFAVIVIFLWQTRARIGEIIQDHAFWGSVFGFLLVALIFSPWLPHFLQQRSQVQMAYWIPRLTSTSIPDTIYRLFIPTINLPPREGVMMFVLILPLMGMILLWLMLGLWRKNDTRDGAYLTIALGLVPFLLGIGISLGSRSLYNDRFFAFAGIFIFIAIAGLVDRIGNRRIRHSIILILIVFFTWAHVRSWNELDITHSPGVHGATTYIMEHREPSDHILVSSPYIYFPLAHYAKEEFKAESTVHLYTASGELSHFSGAPISISTDSASAQDIATYKGTIWVVDTTGFTEKPFVPPSNWKEISQKSFSEVFVHQGDVVVREFVL